LRAEEDRER